MTKVVLIDGDILLYRALTAVEKEVDWGDDIWTLYCDHSEARSEFKQRFDSFTKKLPGTPFLCLSHPENFRKQVYPAYKSNRKELRKPLGFTDFKQWVIDNYTCVMKKGLEADDVMGILGTKPGNDAVILSHDKDLMQIPCRHWVDGKEVVVTPEEGEYLFYTQTLTGDVIDGYPGCKGIGKVKAEKILAEAGDNPWPAIVKAYEDAGFDESFALSQARVARILRWDDWDQEKQEVKLWTPRSS